MSVRRLGRGFFIAVLVTAMAPAGARGATVVNGGFESGSLQGWGVYRATGFGNWFAYEGTETPIGAVRKKHTTQDGPVQAPPQGRYAAVTDEFNPDTLILYQDIALEPGFDHELSLLAYYDSYKAIGVPTPDTLSVSDEALGLPNGEFQANQQFRIDVMKPEAPLESLNPADILRTVFTTMPGDRPTLAPKRLTANLSAFAGQTVRLRIANAVTEEIFNAGIDAVSITSTPPGRLPSGRSRHAGFRFGKARVNRRSGIATLRVSVVGPGLLRAAKAPSAANAQASATGTIGRPIEPVTVPVGSARTVALRLRPTRSARVVLKRKRKLRVTVGLTYMPTAGSPETASLPVTFELAPRSRHRR